MKIGMHLAAAVLAAAAGSAAHAQTMTTVKCDGVDVIMSEEQVTKVKTATGEADFGPKVCAVANAIDASGFAEPTSVNVTMPDGMAYDVMLQAAP